MSAANPKFHRLSVRDVKRQTADALSLSFFVPPELCEDYAFVPGQYLTLRAEFDGEEVRRSYSICSGPDDGELRIAVKQVDNGLFSGWMNSAVKAGDVLDVMTPTGRFGAGPLKDGRIHVAFAAGSGVTPILSIMRAVLAHEPNSRFFLFYGNRATRDILFREELEALKDRYLGRLAVLHILSREEQDLPMLNGRLEAAKIPALLRAAAPPGRIDNVFLCGPAGMTEALEPALKSAGVAAEKIHIERFVSALGGRPRPKPEVAPDAPPKYLATLIVDGKRRMAPVAEGEAILDAALRAGMDLPFACKGGMCSTCRARLVEGTAEMAVNYSLEPWELQAGFVLTCQARPTSAHVIVDFDQV